MLKKPYIVLTSLIILAVFVSLALVAEAEGTNNDLEPPTTIMSRASMGLMSTGSDFDYEIYEGSITITRYIGTDADVIIPSRIEGMPVTSIGSWAFFDCFSIGSIIISDGVTDIGYSAFAYCSSLTSIVIPDSVTSIDSNAFFGCSSLTSIIIPDGVESISNSAFSQCSSLTSIVIPDSVTSIGGYAFDGCTSLTAIIIPGGVTSIGDYAFEGCESLTTIEVVDANMIYADIDGALYDKDRIRLIVCPAGKTGTFTVPDSVLEIGYYAFFGCSSLTSIVIPENVVSIGNDAFYRCSSLTSIDVAEANMHYVDIDGALYNKDGTTLIASPGGMTGEFLIPDGVISIGEGAFAYCSSLTSIVIPDSVTSIGEWAFESCSSLTSIVIPDGVEIISDSLFWECSSLTSIFIHDGVTNIDSYAFYGCSSLASIVIPYGVTTISDGVFSGCTSLASIVIPDSVESIGEWAFSDCSSLVSVVIPNGVTNIGYSAFSGCSSLTSVTMPDSVESIGDDAFSDCISLTRIEVDDANENYADIDGVLYDSDLITLIICPAGRTGELIIPDSVTNLDYNVLSGCSSLTSISIGNGIIDIGDYAFSDCISLTSLIIGSGVNSIGDYAFSDCNSLTSIEVDEENAVYASHDGALYDKGLTILIACPTGRTGEFIIPDRVESIDDYAFSGCSSLTSVTIGNSITSVHFSIFIDCSSLTSIAVSESNANYEDIDGVLYTKDKATLLVFPGGRIGEFAIPVGVISIGEGAFAYCSSLTSITIPESITIVEIGAFYGCSSLISVTIGSGVASIVDWAFSECSSLTDLYFKGDAPINMGDWGEINPGLKAYYIEGAKGFDQSNWGAVETIAVTLPGAPLDLETVPGIGEVALAWTALPNRGEALTYEIWYGMSDDSSTWMLFDAVGTHAATVSNLEHGTTYYFGVKAVNFVGTSGMSEPVTTTTMILVDAPSAVLDLVYYGVEQVGVVEGTGYTLTGNKATDAGEYAALAKLAEGYVWRDGASVDKHIPWTIAQKEIVITADNKEAIFPNAAPAFTATYSGIVVGEDVSVLGGALSFACGYDGTVYAASFVITPSGLTSSNYAISFVDGTLTVARAQIAVPTANTGLVYNGVEQVGIVEEAGYTLTVNKATDARQYTAIATLMDGYIWDDGASDAKEIIWIISPKEIIVTPDGKSKVFGDEDPSLTYTLSETVDIIGNLSRVAGEDVGSYTITMGNLASISNNYVLKMVEPAVIFEIVADVPGVPEVNATAGDGQVALNWTAPSNGGAAIVEYIVYQNGERVGNATGTSFVVKELTNGQAYKFQVAARNVAGIGTNSTEVSATPLPAGAPISGKVVDANGNGIKGVKVSLENGTSVMTAEDGSFTIMASQGAHTLTFSGDRIEETKKDVTVDGLKLDLKSVAVTLSDEGGDNAMLFVAIVGVIAAVIVAAFVFVRMKK